jgi:branched-subunit amino acid aminotransferase/4-amino-4-deoxychorismate lyase
LKEKKKTLVDKIKKTIPQLNGNHLTFKNNLDRFGLILNANQTKYQQIDFGVYPVLDLLNDLWTQRARAVFEVMIAKKDAVFHVDDHLKRLFKSMEAFNLEPTDLPDNKEWLNRIKYLTNYPFKRFLKKAIKDVLRWNSERWDNCPYSLVKLVVSGGLTENGISTFGSSSLYIMTMPFEGHNLDEEGGYKLQTVFYKIPYPQAKTIVNYAKASASLSDIIDQGYEEILYAPTGIIPYECSRANFFLVFWEKDRVIIRTMPPNMIVSGVTRKVLKDKIISRMDFKCEFIDADLVYSADEAFVTSTTLGVWPVVQIDGIWFGTDQDKETKAHKEYPIGTITLQLRRQFMDYQRKFFKKKLNS